MQAPVTPHSTDSMTEEELSNRQLYELHRFAELGRLSASLLHEISNPLTAALLHLEEYTDQASPGIRRARHNIQLLRRYVESARQQVRRESQLSSFRVRPQMSQLKRIIVPVAKRAGVQLVVEASPLCRLYGDPVKFQHILANLVLNAIDSYIDDQYDGLIKSVRVKITASKQTLTISVIDWGHGIAAHQLPQVFEPFFSTKSQTGHGLGIGLTIVKEYVTQDFGGSITVTSSRRHGTQFIIKLPLSPS